MDKYDRKLCKRKGDIMAKTQQQMIQELYDTEQVRKLMAKYVYYSYAREWEHVPPLFAKRSDIWIDCEGMGTFDGDSGIREFFVKWHKSLEGDGIGTQTLHTLSTEIIEVAGDGKTARGLWISPGTETKRSAETKELEAYWIWGLYAIDFIKEDGEWCFWHFRIPHLLFCDFHHSWVDLARTPMTERVANDGRPKVDRPQQCEPTYYNLNGLPSKFFMPPRRYETEADLKDFWVLDKNKNK
jgi:hypothetical protein